MRLSDARLRRRQSKLIYPNHRPSPCLIETAPSRSLEPIVRSLTSLPILVRPMEPDEHETLPVQAVDHQVHATPARLCGRAMRRILPQAQSPESPPFCPEYQRNGTTLHSRDGPA